MRRTSPHRGSSGRVQTTAPSRPRYYQMGGQARAGIFQKRNPNPLAQNHSRRDQYGHHYQARATNLISQPQSLASSLLTRAQRGQHHRKKLRPRLLSTCCPQRTRQRPVKNSENY